MSKTCQGHVLCEGSPVQEVFFLIIFNLKFCTVFLAGPPGRSNVAPDKRLYDLSANPLKRKRTETVDECMPCLTTSAVLWFLGKDWENV